MSLHGDIRVNNHVIGEWVAQNAGRTAFDGIYRCWVVYTDIRGYTTERRFFIRHNYGDGALVLGAEVMLEFHKRTGQTTHSEAVEWMDFCEAHHIDPEASLGRHITLKETI